MLAQFLVFLCYICFTALGQDLSDSLEVPALGRPFTLGSLYDVRQDRLVAPGVKLWDTSTLKKDVLQKSVPYTNTEVIATSSLKDKASSLGVHGELKASFLCGLITVSGAATYLRKETMSNYEAEVGFLYEKRTHMKEMTMEQLANVEHPSVFDSATEATHVVTRIEYGAKAVFTLKRAAQFHSELRYIHGELRGAVNMIVATVQGAVSLNLSTSQTENYKKFSCKFHGDVSLPAPPTNFFEALNVYKKIPSYINETTAIPVKVYLYALSKLDSKNKKIVRRISASLLSEVERRMEDYAKLKREVGDLRASTPYKLLKVFKDYVEDFDSALTVFKNEFQRELLRVLPKIRGAGLEEIELSKVLDEVNSSFSIVQLKKWTLWKKQEAGALGSLISLNPELITDPEQFQRHFFNYSNKYIISLNLQIYKLTDPYTICMRRRCKAPVGYRSWLLNNRLVQKLISIFYDFHMLHALNKEHGHQKNSATLFVILINPIQSGEQPNVAVQIYKKGKLVEQNFVFPLLKNFAYEETCNKTHITWNTTEILNGTVQQEEGALIWYKKRFAQNWTKTRVPRSSAVIQIAQEFHLMLLTKCSFGICAANEMTIKDSSPKLCKEDCPYELATYGRPSVNSTIFKKGSCGTSNTDSCVVANGEQVVLNATGYSLRSRNALCPIGSFLLFTAARGQAVEIHLPANSLVTLSCINGVLAAHTSYKGMEQPLTVNGTIRSISCLYKPVDCIWGEWSSWTSCMSDDCSFSGNRHRRRRKVKSQNSGGSCHGSSSEESWCTVYTKKTDHVRLVFDHWSSYGSNYSRVEICHNGEWGTVCDDFANKQTAKVVCRMLGLTDLSKARYYYGFGRGTGKIWLDDVRCNGNERHIKYCRHRPWGQHDCTHREDLGIGCI